MTPHRAGFTLLELLVVLVLLGLLSLAGHQALHTAGRLSARLNDDGGQHFLVQRQVADWIAQAQPRRVGRERSAPVMFDGLPDRLTFVTNLPDRFGLASPHLVTLSLEPDGLAVGWRLLTDRTGASGGTRLLLPAARELKLRYWHAAEGWVERWDRRPTLPALVEMRLEPDAASSREPVRVAVALRMGESP